jgi:hypothetical protein
VGSRSFRILLIAFQALWLNVVLPGHTRGAITLGGGGNDACCQVPVTAKACCKTGDATHKKSAPTAPNDNRKARCAVCFFAARVVPPPVFDLTPAPLELLCLRSVAAPERPTSFATRPLPYHGRAPPTSA